METLRRVAKAIWWLAIAYVLFGMLRAIDRLYAEIGCSPRGDCYELGTIAGFELEMWVLWTAFLVWPLCIWFLGGRWLAAHFDFVAPPNTAVKFAPLRSAGTPLKRRPLP